jgi:hypothetical protein
MKLSAFLSFAISSSILGTERKFEFCSSSEGTTCLISTLRVQCRLQTTAFEVSSLAGELLFKKKSSKHETGSPQHSQ